MRVNLRGGGTFEDLEKVEFEDEYGRLRVLRLSATACTAVSATNSVALGYLYQ
jgi:hypothetical protein